MDTSSRDPQWLSIEDICQEVGLGASVVRRLIRGGHLPAERLRHMTGRRLVVKRSDLEAWLKKSRQATRRFVIEQPAPGLGMWDRETGTPSRTPRGRRVRHLCQRRCRSTSHHRTRQASKPAIEPAQNS